MGSPRRRPLIGALLRAPHNAVVDHVHTGFARDGFAEITPAYFPVFQHVDHDRGSRIGWLAERAHVTKQTMGHLVDNLVRWGYVEIARDDEDSRAKLVRLTDRGWEVHELADRLVGDLERRWARELGTLRFEQLRTLLEELGVVAGGASPP